METKQQLDQQHAAFEAYKVAKERMDANLTFETAKAARVSWWKFLNLVEANTAEPRKQ